MFRRVLIANRGEIACRVMATCQRMGVSTVAVYSDADAGAKHVAMADTAVRIGPAPAAESYLRGEAIVAAALATGAEAMHPGYGFLSENPGFVEAVEAAGLVFIGPSAGGDPGDGAEGCGEGADGEGRACRWCRGITGRIRRTRGWRRRRRRSGIRC